MRSAQPGSTGTADGAAAVDFDVAHSELLADPSLQFDLPWVDQPRPRLPDTAPRIETLPLPSLMPPALAGGPVATTLFWVVVGLAVAGLLYLIVARVAGWQRSERSTGTPAGEEWRIEEGSARQLLGDADALAAEGRYSEAAHLLLHRSIAEIDQRRPATVRKALTSRDIAALPALPPSPAAAFGAIVRAVERSLFGGRALTADDWRDCREAYQRFAFAREWQA